MYKLADATGPERDPTFYAFCPSEAQAAEKLDMVENIFMEQSRKDPSKAVYWKNRFEKLVKVCKQFDHTTRSCHQKQEELAEKMRHTMWLMDQREKYMDQQDIEYEDDFPEELRMSDSGVDQEMAEYVADTQRIGRPTAMGLQDLARYRRWRIQQTAEVAVTA